MEEKPCSSAAMNCVAICLEGKSICAAHFADRQLKPLEYKRNRAKKRWPPTPWDDEVPWYEDNR